MANAHLMHPQPQLSRRVRPWLVGAAVVLVAALMVGIHFVGENWPYRYRKVKPLLEDVFGSQVRIAQFHRTYFPHPGFVADGLTLTRKSAPHQKPIGTVEQFLVEGRWVDLLLLRHRVQRVQMKGVHLVLPPPGSQAMKEDFPPGSSTDFAGPETKIEQLELQHSVFEIQRTGGGQYSFPVRELRLHNFHKGEILNYELDMQNALPSGRILARGTFGPLNAHDLGATPISGQFTFTHVNLHDVGEIHGTLSADGRFKGPLRSFVTEARTDTPDFAAADGRPTPVAGTVRCTVNGLTGEVVFHSMDAHTGSTSIHATGSLQGSPKVTNLEITVPKGRAEDLLRPFLHKDVPIEGPVSLHTHAYLGPSGKGITFFQRLKVDGAFDVPAERLTNRQVERSLTQFSQRAEGKKTPEDAEQRPNPPEDADAVSSVKGPAKIENAVVSTHALAFQVAGAEAKLSGTFNLHTSAVHLIGDLVMRTDISHATTGFKSFLLKPFAPFFRKKQAGAVFPIAVTGTSGHYKVSQDFTHNK